MTEANFNQLYSVLMKTDFMKKGKSEISPKTSESAVAKLISSGHPFLPTAFVAGYADPLSQRLDSVFAQLTNGGKLDAFTVETLAGAVYQHHDTSLRPFVDRFLAVISNMYRSFLDGKKRARLNIRLDETLPPLAVFQSDPSSGPFTITCDSMKTLTGGDIGVVSMPHTFANEPLFYGSLAHETGGHDVIHADSELLPQLREQVHSLFDGPDADSFGILWDYWMDEASADVYGVLNMGPTFGHSLALLLAVFIAQGSGSDNKTPSLRTQSGAGDDGSLDPHPTDILRLALIQGVVNSLAGLNAATRDTYNQQLATLAEFLAPNVSMVELVGTARTTNGASRNFEQTFPLDTLQQTARMVGAMIATTAFDALNGHSIQDIETWDDTDENTTVTIAGRLHSGSPIVSVGDDAQIVAGLTLAALQDPASYEDFAKLANDALDGSFATDPFWSVPTRDIMILRPTRTLANAEVKDDPWVDKIINFNPLEDDTQQLIPDAAATLDRHAIKPIPWPAGTAPQKDLSFSYKGPNAVLPKADFVIFTWTSAEANAMAAAMTPGAWAMPPSHWTGPAWNIYSNQWDARFAHRSFGRAPAATQHYVGKYYPITIGGRKVLLFKSNFHFAKDDKSMPVKDMFKQVIEQTGARLVITSGTAGAIGTQVQLGDVAVANAARFKCDGTFKKAPFNGKTYTSDYKVPEDGHIKIVNSKLVDANADQLQPERKKGKPFVFTSNSQLKGEPDVIVTTDSFEFDDKQNSFHLQGLGAMIEMDDAVLGLAISEMKLEEKVKWLAIRNASDPQMPTTSKDAGGNIYAHYGYWTSIPSTLASWAMVLDFPL